LYNDPSFLEIITRVAAWLALLLSLFGIIISRRALRIQEQQEDLRKPFLVPYLQDGYVRYISDGRVYAFLLSVSNPTDSDNAVASIDLRLTYKKQNSYQMNIKVRSDSTLNKFYPDRRGHSLLIPSRTDTHQTVSGWVFFMVEETILKGTDIEAYSISIIDTHGIETKIEPILIREFHDETNENVV
jgi:hypothetical protein